MLAWEKKLGRVFLFLNLGELQPAYVRPQVSTAPLSPPVWSLAFSLLVSLTQARSSIARVRVQKVKLAQWKYPPAGAVNWWLMPEYSTPSRRCASTFTFSCDVGILLKLFRKMGCCCCTKVGGGPLGGRSGIVLMDISCVWDRMAGFNWKVSTFG